MPPESNAGNPCTVEQAIILEVYPDTYSCTVATTVGNREATNVKFATLALHDNRGAGFNYMPQVGDLCYLFNPGDGSGEFIWGYIFLEDPDASDTQDTTDESGPDFKGNRPKLLPGEFALTTQDGNFIYVRRGGVVQLGASELAQRVYIPIENIVRDYFQRYHAFSPIGEVVWEHSQVTKNSLKDGDISAIVKFSCRELIKDEKMSVEVRVGHLDKDQLDASINSNLLQEGNPEKIGDEDYVGDGDEEHLIGKNRKEDGLGFEPDPTKSSTPPGLLSLVVNPQGEAVKYTFQIDKAGNNFIRSESHIHIEAEEGFFVAANPFTGVQFKTADDLYIHIADFIRMKVDKAIMEILTNGDINVEGNRIKLSADGKVEIFGDSISLAAFEKIEIAAPNIQLGFNGTFDLLADIGKWKAMMDNHTHALLTGVTDVPKPPGLGAAGVSTAQTASKIKVG